MQQGGSVNLEEYLKVLPYPPDYLKDLSGALGDYSNLCNLVRHEGVQPSVA